jgi:hypothetical protein
VPEQASKADGLRGVSRLVSEVADSDVMRQEWPGRSRDIIDITR